MSTTPPSSPRPLSALRSMIDTLDHELLQLLVQRMALVAEAAAFKQAHGLPLYDEEREQRVLIDRRRWADDLGLPPGDVEALFRLMLRVSRAHQGGLRVAAPMKDDR